MQSRPDPRAAANLILKLVKAKGDHLTTIALQRLLYLAHGLFLCCQGMPMIDGYFEAWETGPVHPAVHKAFLMVGPIHARARRADILSGQMSEIPEITNQVVTEHLAVFVSSYQPANLAALNAAMMAEGGAWHAVREKAEHSIALGFRIPHEIIRERFRFQRVLATNAGFKLPSRDKPPA